MKTILFMTLVGLCAGQAGRAEVAPMRDAATGEQLNLVYRKAMQEDPMRKLAPAKAVGPAAVHQPRDLLSQSDIICFGGMATLVPKHAILHIPAKLADRLKFKEGSKIQGWSAFFAQNGGWITTVEVSRVQAEGNLALPEETTKRVQKSASLIVATYQGGPISVLPLKVPAEAKPQTIKP